MVPELLTLAVMALSPMLPPEMVPELVTLAPVATAMPLMPPEMMPELVTLAVVAIDAEDATRDGAGIAHDGGGGDDACGRAP